MKIAITGTSKLAEACMNTIEANWYSCRIENARTAINISDVFINQAHQNWDQVDLFDAFFQAWKNNESKHIINISSRAAQPNISKGYLYAAQKAALNHYANNVVYNSSKLCKITNINLGLLNHDLPSLTYETVANYIKWIIDQPSYIEIPDITLQHRANYQDIQAKKDTLRNADV